jgi:hypothetical protein
MKLLLFIVPMLFMGSTTLDSATESVSHTATEFDNQICLLENVLIDVTEFNYTINLDPNMLLNDFPKQSGDNFMSGDFCTNCVVIVVNCPCTTFSAQYCYDCPLFPPSIGAYKSQLCASACTET